MMAGQVHKSLPISFAQMKWMLRDKRTYRSLFVFLLFSLVLFFSFTQIHSQSIAISLSLSLSITCTPLLTQAPNQTNLLHKLFLPTFTHTLFLFIKATVSIIIHRKNNQLSFSVVDVIKLLLEEIEISPKLRNWIKFFPVIEHPLKCKKYYFM